jgi:hypothetical protein
MDGLCTPGAAGSIRIDGNDLDSSNMIQKSGGVPRGTPPCLAVRRPVAGKTGISPR